ncbi:MAG TPA: pitrilysin family protein, partial [Candidatus Deferrimicrobium sp.]|nr:pitrilysin family protein [Candidatus Deferrimicrobium sp.]
YRAGSVVIAAAGRVPHSRLVRLVRRHFKFPPGKAEAADGARHNTDNRLTVTPHGNNQVHLCLGFPGLAYNAREKMAALALNAYLGGGMASVLFQKIREERGLAYSVFTFHDFYSDAGVVGAYVGTDPQHMRKALHIVLAEMARLQTKRLPKGQLEKIKSQMKGQLALGMESTSSRMNRIARQELMRLSYHDYKRILKEVDRITSSHIMELANCLFDRSRMAVAALGPADKKAFDDVL